ncbi:MAG: hypothetical protein FJZ01_16850 [Candidatus Sericytochromatia bacterium]|nr:hypothetical protein [Candidatus Tanganyikabacteria bacterium]
MKKTIVWACVSSTALTVLVGCGSGFSTAPSRYGLAAGDTGNFVGAPAKVAGTGAIEVIVNDGFKTQATAADVASLKLMVVPASGAPVSRTFAKGATATVDSIPAGKAGITIDALGATGALLGTASKADIDVVAGQTTKVTLSIKLNPTVVSPTTGNLGVDVTLVDGDVITIPTPTPGPTATPTPTPAPTATPTPAPGGTFVDGFEAGFGNWSATFAAAGYSSVTTASTAWNTSAYFPKTGTYGANPGDGTGAVKEPGTFTMTLKNAINTSGMAAPKLDFDFAKFTKQYYFKSGALKAEASSDNGATWSQVWAADADQAGWAHASVALPKAAACKVRFSFTYDYYLGTDAFGAPSLDNVEIK